MAKNGSDVLKGQLAEHPQAEHLFIGFFQRVQALVHRKGSILVHQQLGNVRRVGGLCLCVLQRGGALCLAAVVVIAVAGHREQPRPHILFSVKVLQAVQRLEEGLLGQLFGQCLRAGQALQKQVHVPEIEPVNGFHVHNQPFLKSCPYCSSVPYPYRTVPSGFSPAMNRSTCWLSL